MTKETIFLVQFGLGNIGFQLLPLVNRLNKASLGFKLKYLALTNTKGALFDIKGVEPRGIRSKDSLSSLKNFKHGFTNQQVISQLKKHKIKKCIVIDVTASSGTFKPLMNALNLGFNVVLANKKPLSNSWQNFEKLTRASKESGVKLLFECTVGAGLPIIYTLKSLLKTGNKVKEIQGCFSGTLGYIFSELEKGKPFSKIVCQAQKLGYTEPDPRDDLSGLDVARKALILTRLCGYKVELKDVKIENLVPRSLRKCSVDEFLKKLSQYNQKFTEKYNQAKKQGKTLRYVALVKDGKLKVGMQKVFLDSPIGSLKGPENICLFYTVKYNLLPLVIQGPGAGKKVTADGVLRNILECI